MMARSAARFATVAAGFGVWMTTVVVVPVFEARVEVPVF